MTKSFGEVLATEQPMVLACPCKLDKQLPGHNKPHLFYKDGQEKEILDLMLKLDLIQVTKYPIPVVIPGKSSSGT